MSSIERVLPAPSPQCRASARSLGPGICTGGGDGNFSRCNCVGKNLDIVFVSYFFGQIYKSSSNFFFLPQSMLKISAQKLLAFAAKYTNLQKIHEIGQTPRTFPALLSHRPMVSPILIFFLNVPPVFILNSKSCEPSQILSNLFKSPHIFSEG